MAQSRQYLNQGRYKSELGIGSPSEWQKKSQIENFLWMYYS